MGKVAFAFVLAGVIVASAATQQTRAGQSTATKRCPVANTSSHPVRGRPSFNFGNARIAVDLPEGATFVAIPDGSPRGGWAFIQKDGWIRAKIGWFTRRGAPHVIGRKVDGTGRPLRADVGSLAYSGGPFYPSLLYFPSLGCWHITATAEGAYLSAIVNVTH